MLVTGSRQKTTMAAYTTSRTPQTASVDPSRRARVRICVQATPAIGERYPPYGCRLPRRPRATAARSSQRPGWPARALAASGMPPSPIRRTNQAGASTPKPPGPASSAITAAGSEPAGEHDGGPGGGAQAGGRRQQEPQVQCGDDEHEQVRVTGECERSPHEQTGVRAQVAARADRVGVGRYAAGSERAAGAAERERKDDLPERHAAPVSRKGR